VGRFAENRGRLAPIKDGVGGVGWARRWLAQETFEFEIKGSRRAAVGVGVVASLDDSSGVGSVVC